MTCLNIDKRCGQSGADLGMGPLLFLGHRADNLVALVVDEVALLKEATTSNSSNLHEIRLE